MPIFGYATEAAVSVRLGRPSMVTISHSQMVIIKKRPPAEVMAHDVVKGGQVTTVSNNHTHTHIYDHVQFE